MPTTNVTGTAEDVEAGVDADDLRDLALDMWVPRGVIDDLRDTLSDRLDDSGGRSERHLVVCRESDRYDALLMAGMIQQTLSLCPHVPGVPEVLRLGLAPIRGEAPFPVEELREGRTKAVLFEHRGTFFLYSMGGAAKADSADGENGFVNLLCSVIEQVQPTHLWVATFSRLVRSAEFSGKLLSVVSKCVDEVCLGDFKIRMTDRFGQALWLMLSMVSSMERDLIVQRLTAGVVAKFLRNEWIPGRHSVPIGYELSKDKVLRVDASQRETVATVLALIADVELAPWQLARQLGGMGLSTSSLQQRYGSGATYADVRDSSGLVRRLGRWMDLYEHGTYEMRWPNPFRGAGEIAGMPIEGASRESNGFVRFVYRPGVPEGGWAEPELVHAARAAVARRADGEGRSGGGADHSMLLPFTGVVKGSDDRFEYELKGQSKGLYRLYRRLRRGGRA